MKTRTPGCTSVRIAKILVLPVFILGLMACDSPDMLEIRGPTMGTSYSVKVVGGNQDSGLLENAINAELRRLNHIFSTYENDSELTLFNQAPTHSNIDLSAELAEVLTISREIWTLSNGAFDVTVGPLVNLWGFGPAGPITVLPERSQIEGILEYIGTGGLQVSGLSTTKTATKTATKTNSLEVDLSAIAKGYAVDAIADLLEGFDYEHYLVEIGGEVKARGQNQRGVDWVIAIEAPDPGSRRVFRTLPVKNLAMATSGDYRNFVEIGGVRYSHTLDPRTGWPVTHNMGSVTVLHERSVYADGLATAFSVVGLEETMQIAEANNFLVLAITRSEDGLIAFSSSALERYLEQYDD